MPQATTDVLEVEDAPTTQPKQVVHVPITKGKSTLAVSIDDIPADVWAEVILQGLKVLLNRGASKITKEAHKGNAEAMQADAMQVATKQLEKVMTSDVKLTGGKSKADGKAPAKVMARAMQLARALVNENLRAMGLKPAHVEAAEKTKYAKAYLATEAGSLTIERARKEVEEIEAEAEAKADFMSGIAISDKLVKKAAEKKAKAAADKPLSKTQAGKVKARVKGQPQASMH